MKKVNLTLLALFAVLLFQRCNTVDEPQIDPSDMTIENVVVPQGFDYSTTKEVEVALTVPANLSNAVVSIEAISGTENLVISKGTFDKAGYFNATVVVPAFVDTLVIRSQYVGLIDAVVVPVIGKNATLDYRPLYSASEKSGEIPSGFLKSASANGFNYLGTYNNSGVPNYLIASDVIEQNLLDDINASLPESKKVPDVHPEYIAGNTETNIILTKRADVWVTFVHEGAGYRNSLGYYTYKVGNEPKTRAEIEALNVVFPNLSFSGSGGGLKSGNKVYLGQFEANTVVCWFLVADGWDGSVVTNGRGLYYSQTELNPEINTALKNHMVLLWDKARNLLLMGFEDINRESRDCDQDFNDAVYYATVNPVDAIKKTDVQEIEAANDADGDGINDELDDFPFDPNKAFNNFYPSALNNGTLVFEDLWPSKGDYDFNDLVVGYNFNLIADGKNKISTIEATFKIKQIGAAYKNGFAFVMPIAASAIKSIEGQQMNVGYTKLNINGTEAGVNETVVFVTENATAFKGKTIKIIITLQKAVAKNDLGSVPFNPFIVVDGNREREVHLPDMAPTSKGKGMLGQKDDYSDVQFGRYYKTERNLPWALNFYTEFNTPDEKVSIDKTYPKFITWANSGGTVNLDWYK
ncbi:MAG: LruC domain-containing protein [Draconibacterium sp.]